jgi:hypothetical protein
MKNPVIPQRESCKHQAQTNEEAAQPPVREAVSSLGGCLLELDAVAGHLIDRISPVLFSAGDTAENHPWPSHAVPLIDDLQGLERRVRSISGALRDALERLAL